MCGLDEVIFPGLENIWYKLLRIAVDEREPGTLHLYHQAMSLFEYMVDLVQVDHKFFRFVGNEW